MGPLGASMELLDGEDGRGNMWEKNFNKYCLFTLSAVYWVVGVDFEQIGKIQYRIVRIWMGHGGEYSVWEHWFWSFQGRPLFLLTSAMGVKQSENGKLRYGKIKILYFLIFLPFLGRIVFAGVKVNRSWRVCCLAKKQLFVVVEDIAHMVASVAKNFGRDLSWDQ